MDDYSDILIYVSVDHVENSTKKILIFNILAPYTLNIFF